MVGETEGPRKGIARAAIVLMFVALAALFAIATIPVDGDTAHADKSNAGTLASIETGN